MKQSVREARPPLTSYCKSGPPTATGCTSGSYFLESRVQRYLYDNTVSFPVVRHGLMGSQQPSAVFAALMAELETLGGQLNESESNGNLRKLARAR